MIKLLKAILSIALIGVLALVIYEAVKFAQNPQDLLTAMCIYANI